MSELTVFNFNEKEVRTVIVNNEPYFVFSDLCKVLEYTNPSKSIELINEDDLTKRDIIDKLGRKQGVNVVNESGLYTLIIRSNKPNAKEFQRWITKDVLPSIRKTGKYETNQTKEIENLTEINQLKRLLSYSYYTPEKVISIIKWFYIHEHIATNSDMTREKIENMLRYINCNPPLKVNEICKLLDISKTTFYRYKKLIDEVYNNMGIEER